MSHTAIWYWHPRPAARQRSAANCNGYSPRNHIPRTFIMKLQLLGGIFNVLGKYTRWGNPLPHPHQLTVTDIASQSRSRAKCTVQRSCAWACNEVEHFSSLGGQSNICPWECWWDPFFTFKALCALETASLQGHLFCHAATSNIPTAHGEAQITQMRCWARYSETLDYNLTTCITYSFTPKLAQIRWSFSTVVSVLLSQQWKPGKEKEVELWAWRCEASYLVEGKLSQILPPWVGSIFLLCQGHQEHIDINHF